MKGRLSYFVKFADILPYGKLDKRRLIPLSYLYVKYEEKIKILHFTQACLPDSLLAGTCCPANNRDSRNTNFLESLLFKIAAHNPL